MLLAKSATATPPSLANPVHALFSACDGVGHDTANTI